MKGNSISEVLQMSVSERILFIADVWDSIVAVPESVELTEEERQMLDRRLQAYHNNPAACSPWEEVKARLLKSI
jgi:putative addiction module component (TIGR02574 family)